MASAIYATILTTNCAAGMAYYIARYQQQQAAIILLHIARGEKERKKILAPPSRDKDASLFKYFIN
jgi:hypothetical protein